MAKKEDIDELKTIYEELGNKKYAVRDLVIGTIQSREVSHKNANCKCKKGNPHGPYPYLAFSSKEKGRMISVYISKNELPIINKKLDNYQTLHEDIEKMLLLALKIKKIEREKLKNK